MLTLQQFHSLVPIYLLALVRVAGIVFFAPLVGSSFIPFRVKTIIALALTLGLLPIISIPTAIPANPVFLTTTILTELAIGIIIGVCANLAFVAARWAGEMIGQQMGFTLSGVLDPQLGSESSVLGDFYSLFATLIFLLVNGHHALITAIAQSFRAVPLMNATIDRNLFNLTVSLLQSATLLALQLAAPLLVTMLIIDIALGVMSRVVPQMNVLAMGLSVRSAAGLVVLLLIAALTASTLGNAMTHWMKLLPMLWKGAAIP